MLDGPKQDEIIDALRIGWRARWCMCGSCSRWAD